jgi:hypothetical protein
MVLPIRKDQMLMINQPIKNWLKALVMGSHRLFQKAGNPLNEATLAVFGGFSRESTLTVVLSD